MAIEDPSIYAIEKRLHDISNGIVSLVAAEVLLALGDVFPRKPLEKIAEGIVEWRFGNQVYSKTYRNHLWPRSVEGLIKDAFDEVGDRPLNQMAAFIGIHRKVCGARWVRQVIETFFERLRPREKMPDALDLALRSDRPKTTNVDQKIQESLREKGTRLDMSSIVATRPDFLHKRIMNALDSPSHPDIGLFLQHPSQFEELSKNEAQRVQKNLQDGIQPSLSFFSIPEMIELRHIRIGRITDEYVKCLLSCYPGILSVCYVDDELITTRSNAVYHPDTSKIEFISYQQCLRFENTLNTITLEAISPEQQKAVFDEFDAVKRGQEEYSLDKLNSLADYFAKRELQLLDRLVEMDEIKRIPSMKRHVFEPYKAFLIESSEVPSKQKKEEWLQEKVKKAIGFHEEIENDLESVREYLYTE